MLIIPTAESQLRDIDEMEGGTDFIYDIEPDQISEVCANEIMNENPMQNSW